MTKRIVSGVFLLVALGALGLILAGALTSGEQLIVRFLTAIIVAALGLYVISDLRLQADDTAVAKGVTRPVPATAAARGGLSDSPPPNSTAAFMATVTGKKSSTPASSSEDGGWSSDAAPVSEDLAKTGAVPIVEVPPIVEAEPLVVANPEAADDPTTTIRLDVEDAGSDTTEDEDAPEVEVVAVSTIESSPYAEDDDDLVQWPLSPDGTTVDATDKADETVDALSAVFEKAEQNETATTKPVISMASVFGSADTSTDDTPAPVSVTPVGAVEQNDRTTEIDSDVPDETTTVGDQVAVAEDTGSTEMVVLTDPAAVTGDAPVRATGEPLEPMSPAELAAASYAQARIIDLRLSREATADIEAAIRSGEVDVISSLLDEGVLSPEGPINDRDVRTMVYVAFTSNELRKILLAGGTVDGDQSDLDLGPVEVFTQRSTTEQPPGPTSIGPGSAVGLATPALAGPEDVADETADVYGPVVPITAGADTTPLATVTPLGTDGATAADTDDALNSAESIPADLSPFAASEG